ncbi:MAG: hypothetical protein U0X39_15610 [Bacteroidales bacterium]
MKTIFKFMLVAMALITITLGCSKKPVLDKSNPFFSEYNTPFSVPPFEKIMAKHYVPAFEEGLKQAREELNQLVSVKDEPTFDNTVAALDKLGKLLNNVSLVFYSQSQANTNDSLRKIDLDMSPKLTEFQDEINLNPVLFGRVKSVYENQDKFNLTAEQKFYLENLYKGFVRNGANLGKADQDTLKSLNQKLTVLSIKFGQNVQAENNNYKLYITRKEDLAGLPETVISAAADQAKAAGFEGKWAFTPQRPSTFPSLLLPRIVKRERNYIMVIS